MSVEGWAWAGWARAEHAQEHHQSEPKVSRSACAPWQPAPRTPLVFPVLCVSPWLSRPASLCRVGGGPQPVLCLHCLLPANRFRCVSWFSLCLTLTELRSSWRPWTLFPRTQDTPSVHMTTWHIPGSRQVEHTWILAIEGGGLKGDPVPCPNSAIPSPTRYKPSRPLSLLKSHFSFLTA